jgi:hypothetical protein
MVTWKEFGAAEPDLAEIGCSLLFQHQVGLAFLATVRKDGAPRLHPVCPVLSNHRLFVLVTPTSPKRYDLQIRSSNVISEASAICLASRRIAARAAGSSTSTAVPAK